MHDYRGRIKWLAIEKPIVTVVNDMPVAGTPDRLCLIDEYRYVIDLKNSATYHPSWDLQLTTYSRMVGGGSEFTIPRRMVVQLLPTGKYKATVLDEDEGWAAAHAALALTHWKMSRGLWSPTTAA